MKTNKKASLNTEMIVAIIAIIMIAIAGFFAYNFSTDSKKQYYEMAPELNYQFPVVFTHAFLMETLTKEEKEKLSLDKDVQYFVKDLMVLATDDAELILKNKRDDFISEHTQALGNDIESPIESFEKFSGQKIDKKNLLYYTTEPTQTKDLEDEIKDKSYFFYVKNMEGEYGYMRFYKQ